MEHTAVGTMNPPELSPPRPADAANTADDASAANATAAASGGGGAAAVDDTTTAPVAAAATTASKSTVPPARTATKKQQQQRARRKQGRGGKETGKGAAPAAINQKLTHLVIDSGAIIKGAGMTLSSAAEVYVSNITTNNNTAIVIEQMYP